MDFKPNGERLLVKTTIEEKVSESGFILPDSEKGELVTAKVIAGGDWLPVDARLGRTAYFKDGDGFKITLEGESYLVIDDEKVLGFV